MSEATYKVVDVYYRWKDENNDTDQYGVYSGLVGVGVIPYDPETSNHLDDRIFFYVQNDDELEVLYNEDNGQDFVLIKENK